MSWRTRHLTADEWQRERQLDRRSIASDSDRRFLSDGDLRPSQVINTVEVPINPAARPAFPPGVVSSTVWCASPAGLKNGVGGALTTAMPDATIAERQAAAEAAQSLP